MTRRVVITGMGVITPLGDSPAAMHAALVAGASRPVAVDHLRVDGIGCRPAFSVPKFVAEKYVGSRNLRPLDRTAQLLACAVQLALRDSKWTSEKLERDELGLVVGTMFSSLHTISVFDRRAVQDGPCYASPMDFANTVINSAAGQAAIWHNLRGINATVSAGATSGLHALAHASELIRSGHTSAVLAGGVEELCFEIAHGYERAGLLAAVNDGADGQPLPFDRRRTGFVLGEGAAVLMLEDQNAAEARGARALAEIRGDGAAFDYTRGWQADRASTTIASAMRKAMDDARLKSADVNCVSASANGSPKSDRYEAAALKAVFNERYGDFAITAVKAHLGEALGASGAVLVAAQIEAMHSGKIPGLPKCDCLEESFLHGRVASQSRELAIENALVNSVGLDGHCCSLVLSRVEG
jgi:3-oxoacyl-[acyl-carrier-protein] synthase II